ncbi:hypothetical protein D3C81_1231120 [compost metagenome]
MLLRSSVRLSMSRMALSTLLGALLLARTPTEFGFIATSPVLRLGRSKLNDFFFVQTLQALLARLTPDIALAQPVGQLLAHITADLVPRAGRCWISKHAHTSVFALPHAWPEALGITLRRYRWCLSHAAAAPTRQQQRGKDDDGDAHVRHAPANASGRAQCDQAQLPPW